MGCQGHKEEKPSEHFSGEDVDVLEVMLADATFQAADGELPFAPLHVYPEAMNEYLTELFKLADKNGDGVLQPDELAEVFKLCGFNLTPNQIKEVVEKADVNGDGVIDYKEFVPIATQLLRRGEGRGKGHGRHRVDKDGRYLRPTEEMFQQYWEKCDFDQSHSMNSHLELWELTLNLLYDGLHIDNITIKKIKEEVEKLPQETNWKPRHYKSWFFGTFEFSHLDLDDVAEALPQMGHVISLDANIEVDENPDFFDYDAHCEVEITQSQIEKAIHAYNGSIHQKFTEMKTRYGGRGQRAVQLNEKLFGFTKSIEYQTEVEAAFCKASGDDNKPLSKAQFQDGFKALITSILQFTGDITKHVQKIEVKMSLVKEWFPTLAKRSRELSESIKLVDDDESSKISKSEFAQLVDYVMLLQKLENCDLLLKYLSGLGENFRRYKKTPFIMGGDCTVGKGFELTSGDPLEEGHLICEVPCKAASNEVHISLDYYATQLVSNSSHCGEGLCIYLADPTVDGVFEHFDGEGPCGFLGKKGGVCAVFLDLGGHITGEAQDHVCVRSAAEDAKILGSAKYEKGCGLRTDGKFKPIKIKFDTADKYVDVTIDGLQILKHVAIDFELPEDVVVGVCAAASDKFTCKFAVNNLKVDIEADDDKSGVPKGCIDYVAKDGRLKPSNKEEIWRCAVDAKIGYGFELTADKDNQQGHLLCRHPFNAKADEIHCSFVYTMKPKSAAEGGGQGICAYLCDPSIYGWDRHFDGSGPLGFVGKKGAIVGVGIDCTGTFCEGQPSSIAIKRASDGQLLCDPVVLEGGVVTKNKEDFWRKVHIKFDIEENTCDVTIGGIKVLDDIKFTGIKIPKTVCVGVCAGTADGKTNNICINKLKLKSEDD